MKKFISILFCLFMFPLFLNTSQVNAQSDDPRNIMNSESVDFNKETLQLHTRIAELEGLLSEANAKISDLESTLGNMVTSEKYAEAERQLEVANAKISDLGSRLAKADQSQGIAFHSIDRNAREIQQSGPQSAISVQREAGNMKDRRTLVGADPTSIDSDLKDKGTD